MYVIEARLPVYLSLILRHGFAALCCAVLSGGDRTGAFRGLGARAVFIADLALKLKLS